MYPYSYFGDDLVGFVPPDAIDPDIPVTFTAIVAEYEGRALLIFNSRRSHWETPGGRIKLGESLEQCAARELMEEACQVADGLTLRAYARIRRNAREGREEYCAVYSTILGRVLPFTASAECTRTMLWDGQSPLNGDLGAWSREFIKYCSDSER